LYPRNRPSCAPSEDCPVYALLWLAAACAAGADWSPAQFASGVNIVEVYATVTDREGQLVRGLSTRDFQVYEDGEPQTVAAFTAGEFPLSVALAIDRSASMAGERLGLARRAARSFLHALGPEDRAMVVAISGEVQIAAPLSTDRGEQVKAVDGLDAWSTTALHDAIIEALDRIQPARGRRALVLLSDGDDRYSRATAPELLERARAADVLVYPIALGKTRPSLFVELAVLTGGRSFHAPDPRQLEAALAAIARELRCQYLLGYTPSRPIEPASAEWRSIRVEAVRAGLRVRARDGYLAR
jgi:Ca-activated chloride channel family protein